MLSEDELATVRDAIDRLNAVGTWIHAHCPTQVTVGLALEDLRAAVGHLQNALPPKPPPILRLDYTHDPAHVLGTPPDHAQPIDHAWRRKTMGAYGVLTVSASGLSAPPSPTVSGIAGALYISECECGGACTCEDADDPTTDLPPIGSSGSAP